MKKTNVFCALFGNKKISLHRYADNWILRKPSTKEVVQDVFDKSINKEEK